MQMQTATEALPIPVDDDDEEPSTFNPLKQTDLLANVGLFLNAGEQVPMIRMPSLVHQAPITLKLFPKDYRGKFEQACLHGAQQRVTRVLLARPAVTEAAKPEDENLAGNNLQTLAPPKLELKERLQGLVAKGQNAMTCEGWKDFPRLTSVHIDVLALGSLKQEPEDFEHFLSLLTHKGEKEVRLAIHQLSDAERFSISFDAFSVPTVLDRLVQTGEPFFHTLALPIRYISRGPIEIYHVFDVSRR